MMQLDVEARPVERVVEEPRPPRREGRGDRLAIAILICLPIAIYFPFALAGHPVLGGDNLTQNMPLRVLVGEIIRSGHLPAWNAYDWSGTPLLAGWNAGAAFPLTALFVFLPVSLAWTTNLVVPIALSGVGMFLLLRRFRVGALAAFVGAMVFTYTGFMSGQVIHLGLVQGTALMPWVLLGVDGLGRAERTHQVGWNVVLVGVALALTVLAGDPRAITSTVIAAAIYAIGLIVTRRRGRARLGAALLAAAGLGALLSAIQWVPGLSFLAGSQRSSAAYTFFGSGSLGFGHIAVQLLAPFIMGGNLNFGQPLYLGDYNLPEVLVGCGLLTLVATLLYLPALNDRLRRGVSAPGGPSDGRHLITFYFLGLVGVLLTLGATIPLGHLLVHIPLFGSERLQNRNAVLFDLSLAVLVAYLIQDIAEPTSELRRILAGRWRLVGLIPPVCCVGLIIYAWTNPIAFQSRMHAVAIDAGLLNANAPYLITAIVLALAVAAVVLVAGRIADRWTRALAVAVVLAEVGLYAVNAEYTTAPVSTIAQTTALGQQIAGLTGPDGRFAVYNPAFEPTADMNTSNEIGVPDLNAVQHEPSVEGYGSIVNGVYQNITATHYAENLNASALAAKNFDTLDLRTLLTLPIYFGEPIPIHVPIPLALSPGNVQGLEFNGLPPFFSGPWPLGQQKSVTFALAKPTVLRRATVALDPAPTLPHTLVVTASGPGGVSVTRTAHVVDGQAHVTLPKVRANQLRVEDPSGVPAQIGDTVVVTFRPGQRLLLDGALQGDLISPHWTYEGKLADYSVWQNSDTAGMAWLQPAAAKTPNTTTRAPGTVQVLKTSMGSPQRIEVTTGRPATLVRSEGYSAGWTARIQPAAGGATKVVTVRRFGLVQAVSLPPGRWVVTWSYAPRSLLVGLVVSLLGLVALLALIALIFFSRRRLHS